MVKKRIAITPTAFGAFAPSSESLYRSIARRFSQLKIWHF